MAAKASVEIDNELALEIRRRAVQMAGIEILFGIPAPAPLHRGKPGQARKNMVSTANTLAFIEFGDKRRKPVSKQAGRKTRKKRGRIGKFGRKARRLLGRTLRGIRGFGRRSSPRRAQRAGKRGRPARPVIRWVAATKRDVMKDGFRASAKVALKGHDPVSDIKLLGVKLEELTRQRLIEVGAVETGQTRDAISHKIVDRFGPGRS